MRRRDAMLLLGLFCLSLALCALTTIYGVHHGVAEQNPLTAQAFATWGVAGAYALKSALVLGACAWEYRLLRTYPPRARRILAGVCVAATAGSLLIAIGNTLVIAHVLS